MPTLRKRSRTLETPANANHQQQQLTNDDQTQATPAEKMTLGYEQSREKRIKENLERMQKLGIVDLSLKLKSLNPPKPTRNYSSARKTPHRPSPLSLPVPFRRSSRLQNVTPVSYSEIVMAKKESFLEDEDVFLEEGSKPEVYTEEHEKLLGDCKMSWTLFEDGYGKDGRIYDSVEGKTCHQCRQKTLGHRTHCSQCNMGRGRFCGDCLYMRYGEHVLEAKQNPNWICPVCRGICNCSFCRQAKGWPPTGSLYRSISKLGFKSVAHYLIQTRRSQANLEENAGTKTPVSAKRSLPFSDTEAPSDRTESVEGNDDQLGLLKPQPEDKKDDDLKGEKEKELHMDNNNGDSDITLEINPELKKKSTSATEPTPDSIGGRLRQRRNKDTSCDGELIRMNEETLDAKPAVNTILSESEAEFNMKLSIPTKPSPDLDNKNGDSNTTPEINPKLKRKPASATEPSADSIGGRLRQRRNKGTSCDGELIRMNEETLDAKQAANTISSESEAEFNMKLSIPTRPNPDLDNKNGR
ncbi:hypothetical protein L1049_023370 [Liquidambar formosana]|uniref:Zinc-finger domain-containing protein n=1 Tax=Liquidambar formosana TaxID=63359 RepID=A0AAP0X0I3_LIQFO